MNGFTIRVVLLLSGSAAGAPAWDYEGHRLINQLALASLPANFPAFVRTPAAQERIAFLAGEPDRWRNTPDLSLKHSNAPDHYFDMDDLPELGLEWSKLPPFRYQFTVQLGLAHAARRKTLSLRDSTKDPAHIRDLAGFLPWTITEDYGKLKSAFSYLKALDEAGTADERTNARQNIVYLMGVMGHFVGDASQPLHTTKHYNGWVGHNPKQYTTNSRFHSWIDGGYFANTGLKTERLFARVRPARLLTLGSWGVHTNIFPVVMRYLREQFELVEPLYRLDKEHKLPGRNGVDSEGYDFMSRQILVGGQMLGDLWLTAWHHAPPDVYLQSALARRKLQESQESQADTKTRTLQR